MSKDPYYLVRGAVLRCDCGNASRKLNLPLCHGVYILNQPMMNADDYKANVNIMHFGMCRMIGGKCDPQIFAPWFKAHEKILVDGVPAITTDSFIVCGKGGLIEPKTSGQEMSNTQPSASLLLLSRVAERAAENSASIVSPLSLLDRAIRGFVANQSIEGSGKTPSSVSDNSITFLANYEKFYDKPYIGLDNQNRTVGYGHVILKDEGIKYDNGITEKEARELLENDLNRVVYQYLNPWIEKNSVTLNQQQYDALVSFTFNTGADWITKYDDLRNILMSENITYEAMHTEFMDWTKVNGEPALGLYRRRMDELNIFFNGDYSRNYPDWP